MADSWWPIADAVSAQRALLHQTPARLILDLTYQPLGAVDRREKQRVTHAVERHAQEPEAFGGRRVECREPVLLCEPMIGSELKAPTAQLLVVLEVRPAPPPAQLLDAIREQTTQ